MQDEQLSGFGEIVAAIMELAEKRLAQLNARRRVTRPAADLVVGVQCGGSDAFSGVTANPAVGYAADLLVRAGATVMFSEVTEVRDGIHLLTARAANEEVARELIREMAWYDAYLERGGVDRSANPSPGNKRGGLTNIVEKALGSIAKAGTRCDCGGGGHGERVTKKGLIFAATPASDFVCGTLQLAAGMNMHIFTTGRGTPYGLAMVPVIKVGVAEFAGRALVRSDRPGCGDDCDRRCDDRAGGHAAVRDGAGGGQRAQADLGGAVGAAQRSGVVQSVAADVGRWLR